MTDAPRLFNDIVFDINRHGLRVVDLFQLGGGWQALLGPPYDKTDDHDRVFGRGNTAEHALEDAWSMAQKNIAAKEPVTDVGTPTDQKRGVMNVLSPSSDSLEDVLG